MKAKCESCNKVWSYDGAQSGFLNFSDFMVEVNVLRDYAIQFFLEG